MPPAGLTELTGPRFGAGEVRDTDADLTAARGERSASGSSCTAG